MDIQELSVGSQQQRDIIDFERLEMLLRGQSEVLEMISRGASLSSILEAIVLWVELQGGDNFFASILLMDDKGQHLLHGAAPNLPDAYNRAIDGVTIGPNVGSCGTAAYLAETVIVGDIANDHRWIDFKNLALSFGLKACWSTPLLTKDGKVLGTFAVYYTEPRRPTLNDLQIIRLVSRTAVIAIEHKQAEIEREQLIMELDNRVRERTSDLRRANESLERSNADLAQYAYVASHDLQEPLRKIRVFSSMLKDLHQLETPANNLLNRIMSSSERMSQLINDLLEYSQLHNHGKAIQLTSLSEIVQNVTRDFELTIKEKQAAIEVSELPAVEMVPLHVNQIFTNLLSNALKFSKDDRPLKITVDARTLSEEEALQYPLKKGVQYYDITFTDNGIGFEPEFADQVFDMFRRLHDRQAYPGSGIGLALCRKIVENHQGHIFAESEEGKGTIIHIILPAKQ